MGHLRKRSCTSNMQRRAVVPIHTLKIPPSRNVLLDTVQVSSGSSIQRGIKIRGWQINISWTFVIMNTQKVVVGCSWTVFRPPLGVSLKGGSRWGDRGYIQKKMAMFVQELVDYELLEALRVFFGSCTKYGSREKDIGDILIRVKKYFDNGCTGSCHYVILYRHSRGILWELH